MRNLVDREKLIFFWRFIFRGLCETLVIFQNSRKNLRRLNSHWKKIINIPTFYEPVQHEDSSFVHLRSPNKCILMGISTFDENFRFKVSLLSSTVPGSVLRIMNFLETATSLKLKLKLLWTSWPPRKVVFNDCGLPRCCSTFEWCKVYLSF